MNRIQVNATFPHVSSSDLAEFKKAAAHALEIARSEPGVLQYDWFFDDSQTVCVVQETYLDSEALLEHIAAMGEVLNTLSELGGGCELEVFGDPSPALAAAPFRRIFRSRFQGTTPVSPRQS
jgi:quinol monooxygenase YgiN